MDLKICGVPFPITFRKILDGEQRISYKPSGIRSLIPKYWTKHINKWKTKPGITKSNEKRSPLGLRTKT